MVRPERFELPTYCSGGNRSIQLSYGRVVMILHEGPYRGRMPAFGRFFQREKTAPWGVAEPVQPCGQVRRSKLKPGWPSLSRNASSTVSLPVA